MYVLLACAHTHTKVCINCTFCIAEINNVYYITTYIKHLHNPLVERQRSGNASFLRNKTWEHLTDIQIHLPLYTTQIEIG